MSTSFGQPSKIAKVSIWGLNIKAEFTKIHSFALANICAATFACENTLMRHNIHLKCTIICTLCID